jgi:hypothetical protein
MMLDPQYSTVSKFFALTMSHVVTDDQLFKQDLQSLLTAAKTIIATIKLSPNGDKSKIIRLESLVESTELAIRTEDSVGQLQCRRWLLEELDE